MSNESGINTNTELIEWRPAYRDSRIEINRYGHMREIREQRPVDPGIVIMRFDMLKLTELVMSVFPNEQKSNWRCIHGKLEGARCGCTALRTNIKNIDD